MGERKSSNRTETEEALSAGAYAGVFHRKNEIWPTVPSILELQLN